MTRGGQTTRVMNGNYNIAWKILVFLVGLQTMACSSPETDKYPIKQADWSTKKVDPKTIAGLEMGQTYLPTYSHIYHVHDERAFDLTTTVSIRNVSLEDTVYLSKADYFNTVGKNIRQYIQTPIYLAPMETIEIVVNEQDLEGGSGANFLFDWHIKEGHNPPYIEAVMISTHGQQGISFTSQGIQLKK
jgi:hypothetical protein